VQVRERPRCGPGTARQDTCEVGCEEVFRRSGFPGMSTDPKTKSPRRVYRGCDIRYPISESANSPNISDPKPAQVPAYRSFFWPRYLAFPFRTTRWCSAHHLPEYMPTGSPTNRPMTSWEIHGVMWHGRNAKRASSGRI
jgi:hypothetical protein